MSELGPDQLDAIRQHYTYNEPDGMVVIAVRMALRTHDAEIRAQASEAMQELHTERSREEYARANRAEEKNTQLREALMEARHDTWHAWLREGDNSNCAERRLAKIDAALAPHRDEIDPLCQECTTEVDCALRDDRSCDFPDAHSTTSAAIYEDKTGMADYPSDDFIRGLVYAAKIARRTARELDSKNFDREGASGASDVCDELQKVIKAKKKRQLNGSNQ